MVFRVYVEKKPGFDVEAQQLAGELRTILGLTGLKALRIVNRYDVEGISQELFDQTVPTVFSEPQVDNVAYDLPDFAGAKVFATEFLPGQFDQRADSAAECIQLISQGERPTVRSAKLYALEGDLTDADVDTIKHYVINPVEAREASLETKETLKTQVPVPGKVETIAGFNEMDAEAGQKFIDERGLAMDLADLEFCQKYFSEESREPTITEIKVIDTYWSDHCRHTTFGTELDEVTIDDATVKAAFDKYLEMRHELGRDAKPVCLMDMGTIGAEVAQEERHPDRPRRVRGNQRLHRQGEGGRERPRRGLAVPVQERDAQPPHRNRTVRWRGHLHRRLHPRPPVRPLLRVSGDARHRRRRPDRAGLRDAGRQAPPAQARHHRRRRLLLLRQPDRSGHRSGRRDLPPRLCGQAHGGRCGRGRDPGRPCAPRNPGPGRQDHPAGRPHRP